MLPFTAREEVVRCEPGAGAMFRKVMVHSMSSPAKTAALSPNETKTRIFEDIGGGGYIAV